MENAWLDLSGFRWKTKTYSVEGLAVALPMKIIFSADTVREKMGADVCFWRCNRIKRIAKLQVESSDGLETSAKAQQN